MDAAQQRLERAFGIACAALAAWLLWRDLTAASMAAREAVNVALGLWGARLLIVGLAVTPLSHLLRLPQLRRLRRPLGLAAAAFTLLHTLQFVAYSGVWPDQFDVFMDRKYLAVGLASLALIVPLAATSFNGAVRWMGHRRWLTLHTLVYPAAALLVAHEAMARGRALGEPGVHLLLVSALLGWRVAKGLHGRVGQPLRT